MKRVVITSPMIVVILTLVVIIFPIDTLAGHFYGIIDYKPSSFVELADEPFFYSIGDTLRYGRTINNSSPVVFNSSLFEEQVPERAGELPPLPPVKRNMHVFVSPDNKKAAIVSGSKLYLTDTIGHVRLLLEKVDYIEATGLQLERGDAFYEWPTLQWDADSRFIYIVRRYKKQFQLYQPHDAILVRIDVDSPNKITDVIHDFAFFKYYFVGNDTICFDYIVNSNDIIWKCFHNGNVSPVISHLGNKIVLANGSVIDGKPFISFYGNRCEIVLSDHGLSFVRNTDDTTDFFSKGDNKKLILKIQGGYNIKGRYCSGINYGCSVLPGGRYVLLNVNYDNFKGQLLVDILTGKYRELPAKTEVYLNLNSFNYKHFRFDTGSTQWPEFVPADNMTIP